MTALGNLNTSRYY